MNLTDRGGIDMTKKSRFHRCHPSQQTQRSQLSPFATEQLTSDWGGGLVSYDAGTQLRSSVHHRCYGTHTPAFPNKGVHHLYGKWRRVEGPAEPKWRIFSIISFLSPEEETHLPNAHRTTERCPSVQRRRYGTRGTADRLGKQKAP